MNGFQEQLSDDIGNVFFEEFAEPHEIDNVPNIFCIIDTNIEQPLTQPKERREGTYTNKIMLYVKAADLAVEPDYDDIMMLDYKKYRVINVNFYAGLYELTLEAVD